MIKIIKKIKNSKGSAQYRRRKPSGSGFVLLFAVTLAALLLAIALGVTNIAFRELKFSTNARDTNDAFFAADTGIERALFLDKNGNAVDGEFSIPRLGGRNQSCVRVTVTKTINPPAVKIISKGYNIDIGCAPTGNAVERQIEVNY